MRPQAGEGRVVTSAAVLSELVRGTPRDAGIHQVLGKITVKEGTPEIGARVGKLVGAAGLRTDQAVDAMLAATAIEQVERVEHTGHAIDALIVTSDLPHLTKLVEGHDRVWVAQVDHLPGPMGAGG